MVRTREKKIPVNYEVSLLTDEDVSLFNRGEHCRLYEKLGAHPVTAGGAAGTFFAVWAPNAGRVAVSGDFNGWSRTSHPLRARGRSGIWEGFIPGVAEGALYKYSIGYRRRGGHAEKADPLAFRAETPPKTASVVWGLDYDWGDGEWLERCRERNALDAPMSIYEVHLGSWRRVPEEGNRWLTYRELAPRLAGYVREMGFTHVELLPLMEHPFYGSWGYQVTGFFSPTGRYGTPQDLMYLVDYLHRRGIGVILDWVPSHFPGDAHGLAAFDGTCLYEHADPRRGLHPEWRSLIFNYGRSEVASFLLSSAHFWLDRYHADGLRVDAVASMLYLDYGRGPGEWLPNEFGGHENLEAVAFLRRLNETVYREHPGVQVFAEESTAWPMVSRPVNLGGLGFGFKWDMGWMHDTLDYFGEDPANRRFHHDKLTFRIVYAFAENFVLPLSHDEVVHGKGSLLRRMPGEGWQKFAGLRLLFGYMYAQPGKKLLFMGGEFGQEREWAHEESLDWHLLDHPQHAGVRRWLADLNRLYLAEPALHQLDFDQGGFEWVDEGDYARSVLSFIRKGAAPEDTVLVVCNFTPEPRFGYRVGVPRAGCWEELLNGDAGEYGGGGRGNPGGVTAAPVPVHGRPASLSIVLPPLAALFFKRAAARPASD